MTVRELIAKLENLNYPDAEVILGVGNAIQDGLTENCRIQSVDGGEFDAFVPMAMGGLLMDYKDAEGYLGVYQDVVILNPCLHEDTEVVLETINL